MARKRPMTTEGLFDTICKILKEKGKLPDILDWQHIAQCQLQIMSMI